MLKYKNHVCLRTFRTLPNNKINRPLAVLHKLVTEKQP